VILAGYLREEPRHIEFENGVCGKPAILSRSRIAQNIQFSLSHSKEYAIMAVATGRAVGVDLELCERGLNSLQLAQRFFPSSETRKIAQVHRKEQNRMFYRYWTAKEAYVKGRGVGLSLGLDWFELLFNEQLTVAQVRLIESGTIDENWTVQPLQITAKFSGALAVEGKALRIRTFKYDRNMFH
jgi:4'-phosphopantetheinyl transferase